MDGSRDGDGQRRSTGQLIRDIVSDARDLVQQEVSLARIEMTRAVGYRAQGAAAFAIAAAVALLAVLFAAFAAAAALAIVLPVWLACLVVCGALLMVAAVGAWVGSRQVRRPASLDQTKRTLKEDAEWARALLKR